MAHLTENPLLLMELLTAEAAKGAVVHGLVYGGMKRTVHMVVGGRGESVTRHAQGLTKGG